MSNPLLPFPHQPNYSAAAWLTTAGTAEALNLLQKLTLAPEMFQTIILTGAPATGKTHLLSMAAAKAEQGGGNIMVVDKLETLTPEEQEALFHTYNRLKEQGGILLLASRTPPAELPETFLPDLKSRLTTALILPLKEATDAERKAILLKWVSDLQLTLPPAVLSYLLLHAPRNLSELHTLTQTLNTLSLEEKRPLTIPLIRPYINSELSLSI
ncbi:MAG: hypothetical protein COY40_01995 [Alphaproteobacteria bacterium CG_4_10_14_0_8_um_filter_53_9]|nr:MAG: hypothetical protein COY40_01995 [Alphaproteobacteria bacterium CG_4_10_14_0_8_um_filter_53_9]